MFSPFSASITAWWCYLLTFCQSIYIMVTSDSVLISPHATVQYRLKCMLPSSCIINKACKLFVPNCSRSVRSDGAKVHAANTSLQLKYFNEQSWVLHGCSCPSQLTWTWCWREWHAHPFLSATTKHQHQGNITNGLWQSFPAFLAVTLL